MKSMKSISSYYFTFLLLYFFLAFVSMWNIPLNTKGPCFVAHNCTVTDVCVKTSLFMYDITRNEQRIFILTTLKSLGTLF